MSQETIIRFEIFTMRNLDATISNATLNETRIAAVEILHFIDLYKGGVVYPFRMTKSIFYKNHYNRAVEYNMGPCFDTCALHAIITMPASGRRSQHDHSHH